MRRIISFAAITVALNLLLFQTGRCDAELIVSPSAYADAEADGGGSNVGVGVLNRMQQVFPASDFQSFSGVGTITQFAWRPDGTRTTPFQCTYSTLTIKFSTTSANPGSLSMTYADNVGADEVVVLNATDFVISSQNLGPAGGPKVFDIFHAFETPFEYDPSQGNLLMDFTWSHVGEFSWDNVHNAGADGQGIGGPGGSSTAAWSLGAFVTEFTVVPEPSTITLFSTFGMVGAFVAWRKRKRT